MPTNGRLLWSRAGALLAGGSGERVARLFHRLLALVFLDAWLSLGVQVHELIGSRGLLPIAAYLDDARRQGGPSFWQFPTLLWISASDVALTAGIAAGVVLALAALLGFRARLCFAASVALYLSYATACRTFLWFQWDNMLIECSTLALFLPSDRPARLGHTLFRLLLFKLYWESGVAKWQSHLHDWQDGSAMTHYYETAPLPTWLAWYAHNLPAWWHHLESRGALAFELLVPFGIFGPRRVRHGSFFILTAFQVIDAATANYGYFCYLSAALHVFLLDDSDVERLGSALRALRTRFVPDRARAMSAGPQAASPGQGDRAARSTTGTAWRNAALQRGRGVAAGVFAAWYVFASVIEGLSAFADLPRLSFELSPLQRLWAPFRLANTYHLFGHITRERIEPELQTYDGTTWTAHDFKHKAGDVKRAPDFVAPHQPRVDFQLWFYGLSFRSGAPEYVVSLLEHLCGDPASIQGLFAAPLPAHPQAVRLGFWQYHFTTPSERRATGAWWKRDLLGVSRSIDCSAPGLAPE